MNKLEKLALLAAITGLLFTEEPILDNMETVNTDAWNLACKEQSPESFYMKIKEYERKIQHEWK